MRVIAAVLLCLASLVAMRTDAAAQSCTTNVTDVNFGTIDLLSGSVLTTNGSLSVTCSGLPNTTAIACPAFSQGSGGGSGDIRSLSNGGAGVVNFNLFRDSGLTQVWGGSHGGTSAPTIAVPLDGNGNGSVSGIVVYGAIYAGQNLALSGSYSSSIVVATQSGYSTGVCGQGSTTPGSFLVLATYTPTCSLSTSGLNFGTVALLNAIVDGQTNLSVTCTNGSDYTIALDGGLSGATNPEQRVMTRAGNTITYGLYRDGGRSLPWGSTAGSGGNVLGSTGTGATQLHPIYGRIPAQSLPPVGTYTDLIVVTVTN